MNRSEKTWRNDPFYKRYWWLPAAISGAGIVISLLSLLLAILAR